MNSFFKKIKMESIFGFSLIEVLIAISILSTGLLAVANMQITSLQVSSNSKNIMRSTSILQDTIEYLMSLPYDDDLLLDNTDPGIFETHLLTPPPTGYTVKWEIDDSEELNEDESLPLKKYINITAKWNSGHETHSISFPLILTPNNI